MAYKRPLVLASGLIQELQAGDTLDTSASLQFSGLTASQVLVAASGVTATGYSSLTFDGTTLTVPTLSLGAAGSLFPVGYPPPMLINAALNVYVATTGSDTTGDGTVGNPWKSVAKALAVLGNYTISPNVTVTINVAAGSYTNVPTITVNHPQGAQIVISGAAVNTTTVSSVTSFGTPSNNVASVVIVVANATGIAIGSYLLITPASSRGTLSGTCTHWWNIFGCHKVTNVSGTSITLAVNTATTNAASSSGTLTGLTAIPVTVLNTVFTFGSTNGVVLEGGNNQFSNTLQTMSNLVLVGPGTATYNAITGGNASLVNMGVTNWFVALTLPAANCYCLNNVAMSNCGYGINAYAAVLTGTYVVVNGITSYAGILAAGTSNLTLYYVAVVGCAICGLQVQDTSNVTVTQGYLADNISWGCYICRSAIVYFATALISYNAAGSVYTLTLSASIGGSSCTFTGNGNSNAQSPIQGTTAGNNSSYNLA